MTVAFEISWWIIPFAVTVAAMAWGWWWCSTEEIQHGGYLGGMAFYPLFAVPVVLIVSLTAWLIWSLLT